MSASANLDITGHSVKQKSKSVQETPVLMEQTALT